MSDVAALEEDTLFLACTRPAMIAGVTMEAMGFNMIATTILFILAGSLLYALVGVAFHFIFKAIIKHDHNMFPASAGMGRDAGQGAQFRVLGWLNPDAAQARSALR